MCSVNKRNAATSLQRYLRLSIQRRVQLTVLRRVEHYLHIYYFTIAHTVPMFEVCQRIELAD